MKKTLRTLVATEEIGKSACAVMDSNLRKVQIYYCIDRQNRLRGVGE
jgi:hypothetical protein